MVTLRTGIHSLWVHCHFPDEGDQGLLVIGERIVDDIIEYVVIDVWYYCWSY